MSSIVILLSPFWLSWKNDFLRGGQPWRRRWLLIALATAFWCGIYYLIRRVLLYFQSVYDLGPSLAYQLLLIILLTFLSMSPSQTSKAVRTANRIVVRNVFIHFPPLVVSYGLKGRSQVSSENTQQQFAYALYKNQVAG